MRQMLALTLVVLLMPARGRESTPPPINITTPVSFTLIQRTTADLPGSGGRFRLTIGDITGGQVMVTVIDGAGAPVIGPVSQRESEGVPFQVGAHRYVINLLRLDNQLIGDDSATFEWREVGDTRPLTSPAPSTVGTGPARIESLISHIGSLEGATFIRNGAEHTPSEAADHLRLKWDHQRADVETPEDFIRLCATTSSLSGDPYRIVFADGRDIECAPYLRSILEAGAQRR